MRDEESRVPGGSHMLPEALMTELQQEIRSFFNEEMERYVATFLEGDRYRTLFLRADARIRNMHQTIHGLKKSLAGFHVEGLPEPSLLNEASEHLVEILRATEAATNEIIDLTERSQENADKLARKLTAGDLSAHAPELRRLTEEMKKDFLSIMTACCFQDLTGQKMKQVLTVLYHIEMEILTMMFRNKAEEKGWRLGKDDGEIRDTAERAVEQVKKSGHCVVDQQQVDDILTSMGF